MAEIVPDEDDPRRAEDEHGYQYVRVYHKYWLKVGHRDDPPCSGSGYAHRAHGHCPGYGTDRT